MCKDQTCFQKKTYFWANSVTALVAHRKRLTDCLMGGVNQGRKMTRPIPCAHPTQSQKASGNMIPGCCCPMIKSPHRSPECLAELLASSHLQGESRFHIQIHLHLEHLSTSLDPQHLRTHSQTHLHRPRDHVLQVICPLYLHTVVREMYQAMAGVYMDQAASAHSEKMCEALALHKIVFTSRRLLPTYQT